MNSERVLTIPLVMENPTEQALPEAGVSYIRKPPEQVTVPAHDNFTFAFEVRTQPERKSTAKVVKIRAEDSHKGNRRG